MGQGEPLLNYDPVMAALRILLDPNAIAISPKHATLSTSGIVPGIERLAREKVRPKLAISLNASSDQQRDEIMPINRKYPLENFSKLAGIIRCGRGNTSRSNMCSSADSTIRPMTLAALSGCSRTCAPK